jgi:hypothetical protein
VVVVRIELDVRVADAVDLLLADEGVGDDREGGVLAEDAIAHLYDVVTLAEAPARRMDLVRRSLHDGQLDGHALGHLAGRGAAAERDVVSGLDVHHGPGERGGDAERKARGDEGDH